VDGTLTVADLIQQLKGEGIKRIELVSDDPEQHRRLADGIVTVSHRDDVVAIQKSMRETSGCTVLVFQQTCATEKRRRRKRGKEVAPDARIFINKAVCEGCGDCSAKSNCLSVLPKETEFGRKRQIDQAACNKDYSCVNGFCPSFVSVIGGKLRRGEASNEQQIFPPLPEPLIQSEAQIANRPWNIVVTGVGGTGVLTLSAVLAMAAHLEGKGVTSLNQTGLAQKFGPVVSFLRIAAKQSDIKAARVGMASADLLLACDLVVAASPSVRACLNKDRSYAVVNETVAPTAEFVSNPDTVLPEADMKLAVLAELNAEGASFIPATELASGLMGDSLATNLFMLGVAYQKGLIPISAEAINRALEMNGVQIEFNQQAFLWGRRAAVDLQKVTDISGVEKRRFRPAESLEEILAFRIASLTAYQDGAYAGRYLTVVEKVKVAELAVGGSDLALTKAVAKSLHKVMAYKDEYEVARLYSDGSFAKEIAEQFEGDFRLAFHLAPPLFSKKDADTGHLIKRRFGAYMLPMYGLLAKMKFLRGTAFDIFGRTEERKMERGLIVEMEDLIEQLLPTLSASGIDKAVEVVELVNSVRGFGHIKARNYQAYRLKRAALLTRYKSGDVAYVELRSVA
jgi:indolepyruvate ferredoxin oxidoreductase